MVVISETSDDGSNGGDQDKKPKEVHKKLKEKVLYCLPIPDALIVSIFALVPKCHYATLSLVSSSFRRLIASPELYAARSIIGRTECVLYVSVGSRFRPSENPSWYVLHRRPYRNLSSTVSLRLSKVDSLPPMPWGSAVVTIGSEIYVIGGLIDEEPTSNVTLIDCKSHNHCSLMNMEVARYRAAAKVFDGRIYVYGGCEESSLNWFEVFDLQRQVWIETVASNPDQVDRRLHHVCSEFVTYVVMEEKLYMLGTYNSCYAHERRQRRLESWSGSKLSRYWKESSCVIDDMLFSINLHQTKVYCPIIVYDPKKKTWSALRGLQGLPANILLQESKMVNFGGKLVILGSDQRRYSKYKGKKEIWCVEIGLTKQKGGKIWGKVESVAVVLTHFEAPSVELCRTVTV